MDNKNELKKEKFIFWQKWLLLINGYLVFLGIVIAFFNQSSIFEFFFNSQINPVFWSEGAVPLQANLFLQWIYGVLGATIAGWGIVMTYITLFPFKNREKWSWNCLLTASTIWFIVDSYLSFKYNVHFNLLFNCLIYFLFLPPLLFTRKYFKNNTGKF